MIQGSYFPVEKQRHVDYKDDNRKSRGMREEFELRSCFCELGLSDLYSVIFCNACISVKIVLRLISFKFVGCIKSVRYISSVLTDFQSLTKPEKDFSSNYFYAMSHNRHRKCMHYFTILVIVVLITYLLFLSCILGMIFGVVFEEILCLQSSSYRKLDALEGT